MNTPTPPKLYKVVLCYTFPETDKNHLSWYVPLIDINGKCYKMGPFWAPINGRNKWYTGVINPYKWSYFTLLKTGKGPTF